MMKEEEEEDHIIRDSTLNMNAEEGGGILINSIDR